MEENTNIENQAGQEDVNQVNNSEVQQQEPEKSFSQADVDKIVKERLLRESKKLEKNFKDSDDYKKYLEYQENLKTDEQKNVERLNQLTDLENNNKSLQAELDSYKNKEILVKDGVDPNFAEFVNFEINKLVNEETDYNAAKEQYLKDNDKYLINKPAAEEGNQKLKTGQRHVNNANMSDGELSNEVRAMYGLPPIINK